MAGEVVTRCDACRFWDRTGTEGSCRRHAPDATDRPLQVVRWPETRGADGCGEGEPSDGGGKPTLTCGDCIFWHRPGIGIDPGLPGDRVRAWWREAGYCRRHAPRPGVDIGTHAFWRATHGKTDRCFDGKVIAREPTE